MRGHDFLLASAFVHPLLLSGLGLILLPIVIHLLSRRQFRTIRWGATRFLLEAERENRRRTRFEQWLLLALRCLAMALLALLIARPFVRPGVVSSLLGGSGNQRRVIVLDDSASLAYRAGATTDLAALKSAADRLLTWLSQEADGELVTLYRTSTPDEPVIDKQRLGSATLDALRERVRGFEQTMIPARPQRVLARIASEIRAGSDSTRSDVYLLSDFQRSEWSQQADSQAGALQPLRELDADRVRVLLIAAGRGPRDNLCVTEAHMERGKAVAGLPAVVRATLMNYTRQTQRDLTLQIESDGAPLPPVTIDEIEPGRSKTISTEVTFAEPGYAELSVGLGPLDRFAADDVRRLSVRVSRAIRVLLVNGRPSNDPLQDEAYFLRNALAPAGPAGSGVEVEVIAARDFESIDPSAFDLVVLCDVAPQGGAPADALVRFVQHGGGLALFLGDAIGDPAAFNQFFYAGGGGVLPMPLTSVIKTADSAGVGMLRIGEHPITAIFPADNASLSEYVRFRTFVGCDEPAAAKQATPSTGEKTGPQRPPAVVLARYTDAGRAPAIVERGLGDGRVLLFTSSANLSWNNWARAVDGSYLVTMQELAQYLARRDDWRAQYAAGDPLEVRVDAESYEPRGVFRSTVRPDAPPVAARVRQPAPDGDAALVLEGPLAADVGVYTLELTRRQLGLERRPLSVNLDPRESNLAVAGKAELSAALGGIEHEYFTASDTFSGGGEEARRELWPALLGLLLAALLLEQTLAWWFARPGRMRRSKITLTSPFAARGG